MNWRNIDDRLPASLKAEVWVGRHFMIILGVSLVIAILGLVYGFFASSKNADTVRTLARVIGQMSNKVVVVTPDGRVAQIEKSDLNQELLRVYLENFVLTNLVFDKFSFIRGNSYAPSFDKVPLYSDRVQRLLKMKIFDPKKYPQAFKDFKAQIEFLWAKGKADELPEILRPLNIDREKAKFSYNPSNRSFSFYAPINVAVTYFVTPRKIWKAMRGVYVVELAGQFNPLRGTPANPFGMVLSHIKIQPIEKP